MSRPIQYLLIVALLFSLPACASKKDAQSPQQREQMRTMQKLQPLFLFGWVAKIAKIIPKKSKPPAASAPAWVGSIKLVNEEEKFVLIDATSYTVETGETLTSVSKTSETATLKMNALKSPPFLIADIINGKPAIGERVYRLKP